MTKYPLSIINSSGCIISHRDLRQTVYFRFMYQTHKIPQLSAEKSFKIEMLHNTSFSLTTDTFLCLSGAMMDFHPQMLWSLFCSLIKVRIVDFGGMVGSHFKLLHKEKNTKVNVTCSHVWLFTPPHILANSVAGITPKLMGL